jgi:hypothetical protein
MLFIFDYRHIYNGGIIFMLLLRTGAFDSFPESLILMLKFELTN